MSSVSDDRTARAVIRDEALRLFAERGPDAVTVRQIAAAADVSAGLVIHHFGSKDGLREVVDQHVVAVFEGMLDELTAEPADVFREGAAGSLAEAAARHLPAGSPVPAYLRRLLTAGGPVADQVFAALYEASQQTLAALSAAGMASPGRDPAVRAAILLANDMAVLLLQDRLTQVLGFDPLSADGMARWGSELMAIYGAGLAAGPPGDEGEEV